jgi:DNA-directed RNA polymerase specialized sigma24 family protein
VRALRACAEACDVDTWAEFDRCFRSRLVAGVVRALGRGGRRADGERVGEMLQEVYCRLLEDRRLILRRFRGTTDAQAAAYLKRVAETVTVDQLRSEGAAKRGAGLLEEDPGELLDGAVAGPGSSPEARLLARDGWRCFWRQCRDHVRSRHRARDLAILQLAVCEGWTSREIAAAMGDRLTVSSIDTILHRLRRRLAERGLELPARSTPAREVAEGLGSGEVRGDPARGRTRWRGGG